MIIKKTKPRIFLISVLALSSSPSTFSSLLWHRGVSLRNSHDTRRSSAFGSIEFHRWKLNYRLAFQGCGRFHRCFAATTITGSSGSNNNTDISTESSDSNEEERRLFQEQLRVRYICRETDGILAWSPHPLPPAQDLLQWTIDAFPLSKYNPGTVASVVNAWFGVCYLQESPSYAWDLWQCIRKRQNTDGLRPDVVTFSLLYSCLQKYISSNDSTAKNNYCNSNSTRERNWHHEAAEVLEAAYRQSKKYAGSKRRKEVVASRRRGVPESAHHVENTLQGILGSDFTILYENDDILVCNKPCGVSCRHERSTNSGKVRKNHRDEHSDVSLIDALAYVNLPLSMINPDDRGLVHRLDRETSGCIVVAKTNCAHARLVADFFVRRVEKTYTCLVSPVPATMEGTIDVPVHGRPAISRYRVVAVNQIIGMAQVDLATTTGRRHQVRVHCSQGLGCPIVGDGTYGSNVTDDKGFYLHASSIVIPSLSDCIVHAPLPLRWSNLVNSMVIP